MEVGRHNFLRGYGLGVGDFDVLATVRRQGDPGGLRPSELCAATFTSSAGMTGRLDRVERSGFVERRADPEDRRGVRVVLTDAGRSLVDRVFVDLMVHEDRWFKDFPAAERRDLERLLRRALERLERQHELP